MRRLNAEEKCELVSALANAKVNNAKKSKTFKSASEDAHHEQDRIDLATTAERFDMWSQLDESLVHLILDGKIVIVEDGDEDEV